MRTNAALWICLAANFSLVGGGLTQLRAESPSPDEQPIARLPGHGGHHIAFSRDGKTVVTGDDRFARAWSLENARPLGPPVTQGGELVFAGVDPTGKRLLTASGQEACLWDVGTGDRVRVFRHGAEIQSVGLDAPGVKLLTAGGGVVRVWDVSTGERDLNLEYPRRLYSAEFAAGDSRILAIVYWAVEDYVRTRPRAKRRFVASAGQALVWDVSDGCMVGEFPTNVGPAEFSDVHGFHPAALSPDGGTLALRQVDGLRVVNPATNEDLADVHTECNEPWLHDYPVVGGRPTWFAFRPDGLRFLTTGASADVVLWDRHAKELKVLPLNKGESWQRAAFAAEGRRLLLTGAAAGAAVLDMPSGDVLIRVPAADWAKLCAAVSADGRYVAAPAVTVEETAIWRVPSTDNKR